MSILNVSDIHGSKFKATKLLLYFSQVMPRLILSISLFFCLMSVLFFKVSYSPQDVYLSIYLAVFP